MLKMIDSVIYKKKLTDAYTKMTVGKSTRFLAVKNQNNIPTLWYQTVPGEGDQHTVDISMYPTGQIIRHETGEYLDTVLLNDDSLVLHVFMKILP